MSYRVNHQCIDPVESNLAQDWGEQVGLDVQTAFPKDGPFPTDVDGLVINVNHLGLTPLERAWFVRRLYLTLLPYPVAVTCYDLEPGTIAALHARGILVARHLDKNLVRELAQVINARKRDDDAAA
jgi:hypothetical protein